MSDQGSENELEITPEMVEAGLKVYEEWLPWDAPRSLDEASLLAAVFRSMYECLCEAGA